MNHNLFLRTQKVLSKITLKTPLIFDEYLGERKGKYLTDMNTDCWYIPNVDFDKSQFRDF